ncbi:MAG: nucleoside-diphosphate kinase [Chloroflexaceae bacterium]|nr:nucleoside-diphosphate kinase [Chloroflexaceae bacterium]NJL33881.1 nucleoside-diphosphate kinase [Chloroflexaceae bacterium]NJO05006.1 nucleoside-diphosphate kinase [Chloroflexaceae bacterium]
MEKSLIILKPDAVQRGLIGPIITRLEQRGLKFSGMKLMQIGRALAEEHYGVHKGKPFYDGLVQYITASPVVVIAIQGQDVIQVIRNTVGATNPVNAAPGTIRGDYGLEIGRNLIHASDSPENGDKEVALFFAPEELTTWDRNTDAWIYE